MDVTKTSIRLLLAIALGALALAGNWFKLEAFLHIDFFLGSCFVMLAIMVIGGAWGAIIGLIAASCTVFHYNHPWALLTMTGEALFVSWFYRRKIKNLLICDMVYWLVLGAPMAYLLYHYARHMPVQPSVLMMLKQSLNGAINALLANIAYDVIQAFRVRQRRLIPLRDLLFLLMVSLLLFPALTFLVIEVKDIIGPDFQTTLLGGFEVQSS